MKLQDECPTYESLHTQSCKHCAGARCLGQTQRTRTALDARSAPGSQPKDPETHQAVNIGRSIDFDSRTMATFWVSSKWRGMSMAASYMYALVLSVIGFSLVLARLLLTKHLSNHDIAYYFVFMYILSSLGLAAMFVLGALGKLTRDDHYKDQSPATFLRGGAVVLGTGGLIYESSGLVGFAALGHQCQDWTTAFFSSSAIVFFVLQIGFILNYSKLRVNKDVGVAVFAQFVLAQCFATNICTWIHTLILETMEELHLVEDTRGSHYHTHVWKRSLDHMESGLNSTEDPFNCTTVRYLQNVLAPYTFPLLIEFCVVAATIMIAVWEKCGMGLHSEQLAIHTSVPHVVDEDHLGNRSSNRDVESSVSGVKNYCNGKPHSYLSEVQNDRKRRYHNNHLGFMIGLVILCATIVLIIVFMFLLNTGYEYSDNLQTIVYGIYCGISGIGIVCVILTGKQMCDLTSKDTDIKNSRHRKRGTSLSHQPSLHKQMDKNLLMRTFKVLFVFELLVCISCTEQENWLIFSASVVSILEGMLQTTFLGYYAIDKRCTKETHLQTKPGRQGLSLLLGTNMALWLVNTFLLKHHDAKQIHIDTFGPTPWIILSNVFQPLMILYYFHSVVVTADIIHRSFTDKYIGICRPSKQQQTSAIVWSSSAQLEQGQSQGQGQSTSM